MKKKREYKVLKVLNNNVLIAQRLKTEQEMVIIGKGLGFQGRGEDSIRLGPDQIEKTFVTHNHGQANDQLRTEYSQLLNQLDGEVMGLSEEIIVQAERSLGPLNSHIHIALTDHIGFALERLDEGYTINNPFLEETKILYDQEYKVAQQAVDLINERMETKLPEAETGFIAMHFHAARQNKEVSETVRHTSLLKELVDLVEERLGVELDSAGLSYRRLINHLRFSLDRLKKGEKIENPFLDKIREEFEHSYQIAFEISAKIEERLDLIVDKDEIGFIALHLKRLKSYKLD